MRHIVSFSGGKDSTAMLHWLLEKGYPVDGVVFFDTGWEFPAMLEHIDLVEKNTGIKIIRLKPKKSFKYEMAERPIRRRKKGDPDNGKIYRIGNGWPSLLRRWCTRVKINTINGATVCKDSIAYVGIAADEQKRLGKKSLGGGERIYPLVEWGKTEVDCLEYCESLGYRWGGLYELMDRVSCFCCPLQGINDLRQLRKHFPDLWQQMLDWERPDFRGFRGYKTVHDLDFRFAQEDKQLKFPGIE